MKSIVTAALLLVFTVLFGCSSHNAPPEPVPVRDLTATEVAVVQSQKTFGLNLFKTIVEQEPDTNLFISPLSVSMALGMTYNASAGATREAMEDALAVQGLTPEEINEAYRGLIDILTSLDPKVTMDIANSIWYRNGLSVNNTFKALCSKYFDADFRGLDFSDPSSVSVINAWVKEQTRNKIPRILDAIKDSDVMFLINAVYFKGDWTYQFKPELTSPGPFYVSGSEEITCDFMRQHMEVAYAGAGNYSAIDLPYGNGEFSMTILLPDASSSTDDMIAQIDDDSWTILLESLKKEEMDIALPKFTQEYKLKLNDVLIAMGMAIAFSPGEADFSGLSDDGQFFIDKVLHKTYVKVDEEGTEAAAVTSVEIGVTSAPPHVFVADRPFVYVIRDKHTDAILFVGKTVRPHE
jgi:serpin B